MSPQENVEEWFRHEVLSHQQDYPNLYKIEMRKNQWRFNHESR